MKSIWVSLYQVALYLVVAYTLTGCGGSIDLPPERPGGAAGSPNQPNVVSGYAIDGPIVDGVIKFYSIAEDGSKDTLLEQTTTDNQGFFSAKLDIATQPLFIEIVNGSFTDEISGETRIIEPPYSLATYIRFNAGQPNIVNITPFSMLITGLVEYHLSQGETLEDSIAIARQTATDLSGFDLQTTIPLTINMPAGEQETDLTDERLYGFLLAALSSYSSWVIEQNSGVENNAFSPIGIADTLRRDVRDDGLLDGKHTAASDSEDDQLTLGVVALDEDAYRTALGRHLILASRHDANSSGFQPANLMDIAGNIINSDSAVFSTAASPHLLDFEPPLIDAQDPGSDYISGVLNYAVNVSDAAGVKSLKFAIDSNEIGVIADPVNPVAIIDTARYDDGEHIITVTATDTVGNEAQQTFNVLFDNTAPVINISSPAVTNQDSFTLSGTYQPDGGAGIAELYVQGVLTTIDADNNWQAPVDLVPGTNVIELTTVDEIGNSDTTETVIALDKVSPSLQVNYSKARLSLGNDRWFVGDLFDANARNGGSDPLWVDNNNLSIGSDTFNSSDLDALLIPYMNIVVSDNPVEGVFTPADQLVVSMQYSIEDTIIVPWTTLTPANDSDDRYLVPIASETLDPAWSEALATDVHVVAVKVEDMAGNNREFEFSFRVEFHLQ